MTTPEQRRAFVLGLDGVPWALVDRWTEAGELEHFSRLRRDGVAGALESTKPASTPLAWPSIATGVWPDKHGIYGFLGLDNDYSRWTYSSADVGHPTLWEMLTPAVVGNVPMTYPADEVDGQMVTGMMSPSLDESATYPDRLASTIHDHIDDYRPEFNWQEYAGETETLRADVDTLLANRRRLLDLLVEEAGTDWRLFFFVFTAPDRLQHLYWDESGLLEHYRTLDDILGEVMAYCAEHDATLYVVSDHGFGPVERTVNVNSILREEGYLTVQEEGPSVRRVLSRLGLRKEHILDALDRAGLKRAVLNEWLPSSVVRSVADRVPGEHAIYDVDRTETSAFLHGHGNVYVCDTGRFETGGVDPADRDAVTDDLLALLDGLVDPETGAVTLDAYDGRELYSNDEYAPDIVVEARDGYTLESSLEDHPFGESTTMAGDHRPDGIFLAWGPTIRSGATVEGLNVTDVAPTVLHGAGEPIPKRADGRVAASVFRPDSKPSREAVRTTEYHTETGGETRGDEVEAVEDRLRGLGYIE